jgi:ABC-type transport system substrate-binding protein
MRKDNIALLALFLLTVMAFSLVPVNAFIYPDGSVDTQYENFGPRLDRLQIIMYDGLDAMWTGLQNGEIDVTDWSLTSTWLTTFTSPPEDAHIQVTSYGGEAGMYLVDFNLNNNALLGNPPGDPPGYPNPVFPNPASDLNFRRGVNYLFNRTWYQGIIAGWGTMIYTPVPSYMGSPNPGEGLINQDIRPGGALEALTYPNNEAAADAEFALAKMKIVVGQNGDKRFWDRNDNNICDAGEDIVIKFNARRDTGRAKAAEVLTSRGEAHGFKMGTQYLSGGQDYWETMLDKNYHIATQGYINLGPDPDFLYDLYHVNGYWHSPSSACPNTQDLNDTIINYWAKSIKESSVTAESARLSAWQLQKRFAELAAQIPLYSADGYKAHSRTYVGGTPEEAAYIGSNWEGLCNQMGFGDNRRYTFLNAHPQGYEEGDGQHMTIRYGWKETGYPQHINPLYSESYWDHEVLSKIYDTLGYRDPYDLSQWRTCPPISDWTVGTWMDGAEEKSKVRITLRPDIKFTDGVPLTVDDVIYSLTQVAHDLVNNGWPPPWWWPTAEQVQSACVIDPYNVEILFGVQSYLAQSWALGGFYIIPKHIWKPLIDSGDPTGFAPDPNLIGSGPWRYVSMTPGVSLFMAANTAGSTVTTDLLGSESITSPIDNTNYAPITIQNRGVRVPPPINVSQPKIRLNQHFKVVKYPGANMQKIEETLKKWIERENQVWAQANVEFTCTLVTEMIPDPNATNTPDGTILSPAGWSQEEKDLSKSSRDANSINVYITPDLVDPEGGTTGATAAPLSFADPTKNTGDPQPFIELDYPNAGDPTNANENTTAHEKGHFLGLDDLYGDADKNNLMYGRQSRTDTKLTAEQIQDAYNNAKTMAEHGLGTALTPGKKEVRIGVPQKSPWVNVTYYIWVTLPQDISGGTMGNPPFPVPDIKVDGKDIAHAAKAFGTKPGDERWSVIADITGDYKIDGKDIAGIAKYFGWYA